MPSKAPLPAEMPRTYDAKAIEKPLYDWWEAEGYFRPGPVAGRKTFVISMPPPNVTGALHLGHALVAGIEDAMVRYHRMLGEATLYVPGSDHAGIATQNVVERELAKEGLTRQDLGREEFLRRAWQWKEIYHARISEQQRRLGVSCDWERERFTLDEGLSAAVREAFVRLYERGLIYRGQYLVNWCPRCATAISDLEVEHEETDTHLWYVRYWSEDGARSITVATTRPETILGDTAVAVHPDDERYKDMVGMQVRLPVIGRLIPVIADEAVDPAFGTGAVKVTPAHDPTDYEIGARHGLPLIDVMNDDATMSAKAGPFAGLDRFEARRQLLQAIDAAGDLVKTEPYHHSVGHCQRCDTIVEPRISLQWFVRMAPLAKPAIEVVRDGRIRIIPERFEKVYLDWLENIRDWCISRQLWWGHRIPVWYCQECGATIVDRQDPVACPTCGSARLHQDEDVLDTWFSSGLWPFSTLGWPEDTQDLRDFYPTSVMETGYDIIFFWVARMVMLGLEMTGREPFHIVYLHGLVRNEDGKKISKSMADAWRYDPLVLLDEYGQDPLRFTLLTGSTPGNDTKVSIARVEANRNFANKIWQASRFVLSNLSSNLERYVPRAEPLRPEDLGDPADRWIVSRYNRLVAEVDRLLQAYQFGEAGRQLYDFVWSEYCDWFIEMTKVRSGCGAACARHRSGRLPEDATPIHALRHRGDLAVPPARGGRADRGALAGGRPGRRSHRTPDERTHGPGARHPQRAQRVRGRAGTAHRGPDLCRRPPAIHRRPARGARVSGSPRSGAPDGCVRPAATSGQGTYARCRWIPVLLAAGRPRGPGARTCPIAPGTGDARPGRRARGRPAGQSLLCRPRQAGRRGKGAGETGRIRRTACAACGAPRRARLRQPGQHAR